MISLDSFLFAFTLLLSPFKLSGFNNTVGTCFFNAGTQIMFSDPLIHQLHYHLSKKIQFSKEDEINRSVHDAADAFINLLPDYFTNNTTRTPHNVQSQKDFEFYLRELYKDLGHKYGEEGDTIDPLFEYFYLFNALLPNNFTKNFKSIVLSPYGQLNGIDQKKVKRWNLNVFWLHEKHVKTLENGGEFTFDMFLERFKDFIHFEKNVYVIFGINMIRYMTKEFIRQLLKFEVEVRNWNGVRVKVGLSLKAFEKSLHDLRMGVAVHFWAYIHKNEKWYIANDDKLSVIQNIENEISSYRHHVFRFSVDYMKES